jgi:hypothetical protein
MIENDTEVEEYQAVLDISKTLIRSREVVDQSKSLINKINSYNDLTVISINDLNKTDFKSLDHSSIERSQISKGYDFENIYQKENSVLQSAVKHLQSEVNRLNKKLKEKDEQICTYEEIINKIPAEKLSESCENISKGKINLRLSIDEREKKTGTLEEKLNYMMTEYNKQVLINSQLKKKIQEFSVRASDKKIEDLEAQIIISHENLKNLSKRLEKTESILSGNVTPTRLEKCSLKNTTKLKTKNKRSCALINHKSKN